MTGAADTHNNPSGRERVVPGDVLADHLATSSLAQAADAAVAVRAARSPVTMHRVAYANLAAVYRRRLARWQRGQGPATEGFEVFVERLARTGDAWITIVHASTWSYVLVLDDELAVVAVMAVASRAHS
jgi:hypothetical protein